MSSLRDPAKYGCHESRAIRHAALVLGISPAVAGKRVRQQGIHLQVAALVRSALASGDDQLAERLFAPIEAARLGLAAEAVTPELIQAEERADAHENVRGVAYLAERSRDHRRAWIGALRLQRARSLGAWLFCGFLRHTGP